MKGRTTITDGYAARLLLHEGFEIVDLRPDKRDPQGLRSIYVFNSESDAFWDKLREIRTR